VPWISISTICSARHGAELAGQLVIGHDIHRLGDQELPRLGLLQESRRGSSRTWSTRPNRRSHRHELAVLPLGDLQIDDVVVEKVFPIPRRHRLQLGTGVCTSTDSRGAISR
jgi:hypothetical protein